MISVSATLLFLDATSDLVYPALLASINGKKVAKKALLSICSLILSVLQSCILYSALREPITSFISTISHGNVAREVANAHTLIKLVEVLLLFRLLSG